MRVITGTARGRKLGQLQGMDTRPTTDQVKESIFNIIQFDIEGRRVLDLFAGTGQLGIEALSRGAAGCTFVDQRTGGCGAGALQSEALSAQREGSGGAGGGALVSSPRCREALPSDLPRPALIQAELLENALKKIAEIDMSVGKWYNNLRKSGGQGSSGAAPPYQKGQGVSVRQDQDHRLPKGEFDL